MTHVPCYTWQVRPAIPSSQQLLDSILTSAAAQAEGEEAVRSIIPDATIYKLGHMVGTEDRMYNNYAQLAKSLPFIPIFGGGRTKLQPVYVRNVADAVISSLKTKAALRGRTTTWRGLKSSREL